MNSNQTNRHHYKYTQLIPTKQLGFLQYYMLPQNNQFEYVYRPGDDSFLMLSVLKSQICTFPSNPTIIEIGSGSGILSSHVSHWLIQNKNQPTLHISTDINMDACLFSQKYYQKYSLNIDQICASLFKSLTLANKYIQNGPVIVIFNPPYVPTTQQQFQTEHKYLKKKIQQVKQGNFQRTNESNMIAYSYMGGEDGLNTTRKFIKQIWHFFTNQQKSFGQQCKQVCRAYFIVMQEQGTKQVDRIIKQYQSQKFIMSIDYLQHYNKMNEQLYVLLLSIKKRMID